MKYIFRYSLLENFPNKDNHITQDELTEALQSVKFDFHQFDLNYLQDLCLNSIEKFLTRPQEKVLSVIQDVFVSGNNSVPDFNAKDLENIWEQEKVNVYKSIIESSCKSSLTFDAMEWSVKNLIMRRTQMGGKGSNLISRMKLNCVEDSESLEKFSLTINTSKKGFERMHDSLEECQNAINEILLSEE